MPSPTKNGMVPLITLCSGILDVPLTANRLRPTGGVTTPISMFSVSMMPSATGSIFIEATFRIPGLGRYFVTSTWNRDYPMIMATMLLAAFLWGITYIVTDILYTLIDPRVRLHGRGNV